MLGMYRPGHAVGIHPMPRANRLSPMLCLFTAVGTGALPTSGQETSPWRPVDQTVSDLDLRAASSRQVEQGIGVFGQTGSLYQRPNDGQGWFLNDMEVTQQYQLRQPGFTAWIDRPDYIVQDALGELSLNNAPAFDGLFIDLVPPNTVFDLSNTAQQVFIPYADDVDPYSPRVNTRIDGWANSPQGDDTRFDPPVAHRLPPHLMERRAERRAQEEQDDSESTDRPVDGLDESSDVADNAADQASTPGDGNRTEQD